MTQITGSCAECPAYEIPVFHKALSECGSLEVRPVAICVPQEIQEYCMELFGEDVQIAAASHDLFAKRANGQIYDRWWRSILQEKSACNSKT